jgi:hypothetical protein
MRQAEAIQESRIYSIPVSMKMHNDIDFTTCPLLSIIGIHYHSFRIYYIIHALIHTS